MRVILFISLFIYLCPVLSLDPNWHLVFSDEFNGNTINASNWNVRNQAGNYGNNEQQFYSPSQVSVSNGTLIITAAKIPTGGLPHVSGWIDSQSKFYTTYGRYEFRAKMAGGKGMWPAIWLLSQQLCWPYGAEFDIMEYRGTHPNDANGYLHYGSCCGCGVSSNGGTRTASSSLADSFHVYALEWFPDRAIWYMDDIPFVTVDNSNLASGFSQIDPTPHYIIINSAVGGGFASQPDASTVFPNNLYVDYVRVYHYGVTCAGNTCSNHGCCDSNRLVCVCDAGWAGSSCEQWLGSFVDLFVTTNIQYTPATDVKVNGWGNGFSFYSDTNVAISSGLTITLTNNNCPAGCAGLQYSGGGWTSAPYLSHGTFTFIAKASSVNGTGFSLQAGRQDSLLEQIAFVIAGVKPTSVQLITWHSSYQFVQATLPLGFNAADGFHNYTFVYTPTNVIFYIDGQLKFTATEVIPTGILAMGVYYTAQPDWYGGVFVYSGPTTVKVSQASWTIAPAPAKCPSPPPCQQALIGTGTGLTGDYFDGDSATSFFTNYVMTRIDPTINFNWAQGAPDPRVTPDSFSVRWTGQVQPLYSSNYTFYSTSDDGVRLYVNGVLLINLWVPQSAIEHSGGPIALSAGVKYDIVLEYQEGAVDAVQILSWSSPCQAKQVIPQSQLYPCQPAKNARGNGLTARYYSDAGLTTLVATQIDPTINFNWGESGPAVLRGQVEYFSIAWSGFVQPRFTGVYTFYAASDDGSRLYVNGQLLVDQWVPKSISEFQGSIYLVKGSNYSLLFQYFENGVYAQATMSWSHGCEPKQIIPQSQLFAN